MRDLNSPGDLYVGQNIRELFLCVISFAEQNSEVRSLIEGDIERRTTVVQGLAVVA